MSKDEKHTLSQREYLQKYLDKPTKTKKKSKSSKNVKRIEIIDDDIGIKNPDANQVDELYDVGEDAPQIAAIVDERSLEVRELEKYKDSKWQSVGNSNNQDADLSPPRKGRKETETTHETHSEDLSPPRRNKKEGKTVSEVHSEDLSPPRKNRKDMETANETHSEDLSPPRKSKKEMKTMYKTHSEDLSPPRKKKRHHSSTTENVSSRGSIDKDISPPRRKRRLSSSKRGNDYASDNSRYKDVSPPRRSHRNDEDARRDRRADRSSRCSNEPSSHRRRRYSYEDKSPSRRRSRSSRRYKEPRNGRRDVDRHHDRYSHERIRSRTRHDEGALPSRSATKYHSDRGGDIPSLLDLKVKERKRMKTPILLNRFKSKSPVYTSRYNNEAAPRHISRDKRSIDRKIEEVLHVKKAGLQDARSLRMEAEELLKRERRYLEELNATISGKDAAPIVRDRKTGRHRDIHEEERINSERKKRDDERNEKYYKWGRGLKQVEDAQEKFASDMYEMSKPLARYADDVDLERHLKNQDRDGDPMLNYIRSKRLNDDDKRSIGKIPKYRGSYLPNRFNIAPGYRWDGVDRSNGFEKRWFDKQNDRRAIEEDAYKWSIADM